MDLSVLSNALPRFTSSSNKNSMIVPESKRTQFLESYHRQDFSVPKTIMFYVAKNPTTPECYQKMIKTCKYFFIQNPIIVLQDSIFNCLKWQKSLNLGSKISYSNPRINFAKVQSKFWITDTFRVWPKNESDQNIISFSSIIPKFFRFNAKKLVFGNQVIRYKEFAYLTSSAETVYLFNASVKDENDNFITLEKLVKTTSKAQELSCRAKITSRTFGELLKLPNFLQFDFLCFTQIPETFDIEAFYIYMKKNKRTQIQLCFDDSLSEAYKNRLEEIIDEIIATKNHEYRPPYINVPGIDEEEKSYLLFAISRKFI